MLRSSALIPLVLVVPLSFACKRGQQDDVYGPDSGGPTSTSTPTPGQVCEHLAQLVVAEIGPVDPAIQAETVRVCTNDMTQEQQLRGPTEWDLVARCVLDSRNADDIDRCDQLYPSPNAGGGSQPTTGAREDQACVYMISLALLEQTEANGGVMPEITDEELAQLHQECMGVFADAKAVLTPQQYDAMVQCMSTVPSTAAMEGCVPAE